MDANAPLTGKKGRARKKMKATYLDGTHGAYRIERLIRTDEIDGRTRLGKRVSHARLSYAIAYGYPSWHSLPRPLQTMIKSTVRLELMTERLFSPFWQGEEVAKRFDGLTEILRRHLTDMGLEPKLPDLDAAAVLAAMRREEESRK